MRPTELPAARHNSKLPSPPLTSAYPIEDRLIQARGMILPVTQNGGKKDNGSYEYGYGGHYYGDHYSDTSCPRGSS